MSVVAAALCLLLGELPCGEAVDGTPELTARINPQACMRPPAGALSFCSMVNYPAVVDKAADFKGLDEKAKNVFEGMEGVLNQYDCRTRYSLHNCSDCRDAYKYWACGVTLPRCTPTENLTAAQAKAMGTYPQNITVHPTCASICEDVVRKCPYVLAFACPVRKQTGRG